MQKQPKRSRIEREGERGIEHRHKHRHRHRHRPELIQVKRVADKAVGVLHKGDINGCATHVCTQNHLHGVVQQLPPQKA